MTQVFGLGGPIGVDPLPVLGSAQPDQPQDHHVPNPHIGDIRVWKVTEDSLPNVADSQDEVVR